MATVYGNYARKMTRTSPFVWAHRLEIPSVLGSAAIILSLIAGIATGLALSDRPTSVPTSIGLNRLGFFTIAFFCALATFFWLIILSRTLDLRYSLNASKYPIYAVVLVGAAIMNAPPFVFSNMAEMGYDKTFSWRLFMTYQNNDEPWGTFGLMFYLGLISIAVLFAFLVRRSSFYVPFLSLFIFVSVLLSFLLFLVFAESVAIGFVILYIIASAVAVACGIATYRGRLQKYQDVIFGIILFAFSPASIYLLYLISAENGLLPVLNHYEYGTSAVRNTSLWGTILLFCVGLGLIEITFLVMRKARRYAS